MKEDSAGVAVVTGGASGIGRAIAVRAGADGYSVVLADIDGASLRAAKQSLAAEGVAVAARVTDVAVRSDVQELARVVEDAHGPVSLLVNSAGVFTPSTFLQTTPAEWAFVAGVNLWGVVHTMEAFLPGMVGRDRGRIVNVASVGGLLASPHATSYIATKHAVVGLSESVFRELDRVGSRVGVTVLCPGAVPTNILRSIRNWPERLGSPPEVEERDYPVLEGMQTPEQVAELLWRDLSAGVFWSLPDLDAYAPAIRARADGVVTGRNPGQDSKDWRSR